MSSFKARVACFYATKKQGYYPLLLSYLYIAYFYQCHILKLQDVDSSEYMKGIDAMATNHKQTSARAASAASKVLRDGRTSKASKTAAGSALSQTPSKSKKK